LPSRGRATRSFRRSAAARRRDAISQTVVRPRPGDVFAAGDARQRGPRAAVPSARSRGAPPAHRVDVVGPRAPYVVDDGAGAELCRQRHRDTVPVGDARGGVEVVSRGRVRSPSHPNQTSFFRRRPHAVNARQRGRHPGPAPAVENAGRRSSFPSPDPEIRPPCARDRQPTTLPLGSGLYQHQRRPRQTLPGPRLAEGGGNEVGEPRPPLATRGAAAAAGARVIRVRASSHAVMRPIRPRAMIVAARRSRSTRAAHTQQ
jgi:hypothetical protein